MTSHSHIHQGDGGRLSSSLPHGSTMSAMEACNKLSDCIHRQAIAVSGNNGSMDNSLNNDFFYDDEFSVPFDAAILECVNAGQQLADSDWEGQQLQRSMTASGSDSCRCCANELDESEDGGEKMFTSENVFISSSDISDDGNLFSPLPCNISQGAMQQIRENVVEENVMSTDDATQLHSALFDFAATKCQYVLSFDPRSSTNVSLSGNDCCETSKNDCVDGRLSGKTSLSMTVGSNGAGLTTWKHVQRIQQFETGLTSWQKLKTHCAGSSKPTLGGDNRVLSSSVGMSLQKKQCDTRMVCSGHLLKMYRSSRNVRLGFNSYAERLNCSSKQPSTVELLNITSLCAHRPELQQFILRRNVADRSVQCLPVSVDQSMQTSLNSGNQTADKSSQTPLAVEHMVQSFPVRSRPLPNLDFLRTFPSRASSEIINGAHRHADLHHCCHGNCFIAARSVNMCDLSNESSAQRSGCRRHHSSDFALSNNSSSSSGIEPGSFDSLVECPVTSSQSVPRKPPRLFVTDGADAVKHSSVPRSSDDAVAPKNNVRSCSVDHGVSRSSSAVTGHGCSSNNVFHHSKLQKECAGSSQKDRSASVQNETVCTESGKSFNRGSLSSMGDNPAAIKQTNDCLEVRKLSQTSDCYGRRSCDQKDSSVTNDSSHIVHISSSSGDIQPKATSGLTSNEHQHDTVRLRCPSRNNCPKEDHASCTHRSAHSASSKPGKSILVHRRGKNRSSWSVALNSDESLNRNNSAPVRLAGRPVSLPDATILYSDLIDFSSVATVPEEEQKCNDATENHGITADSHATDMPCDETDKCFEQFRAKKSVSFSEKIFYHSMPAVSPLESPMCPVEPAVESAVIKPCELAPLEKQDLDSVFEDGKSCQQEAVEDDLPPTEFTVSPPSLSPSSSLILSDMPEISSKKDLVLEVMHAVELLLNHFSQERDVESKAKLGSTVYCDDVGKLVLSHLCPAIHAVLLDGLKPHLCSFFGKVKNSAWKVVEESVDVGEPVPALCELLKCVRSMKYLSNTWLLFNAFIFALLNNKALDFWLTHLHAQKTVVSHYYTSSAFILLTNSSVIADRLFIDLITAVQPLAQLPFSLEYDYETRQLEQQRSSHMDNGDRVDVQMSELSVSRQSIHGVDSETINVTRQSHGSLAPMDCNITHSLTLAKTVLNGSSVTSRPPRPLSLPNNLLDLNKFSSTTVNSDILCESSEDSVDSSGFFQRLADHMKIVTRPRDPVYRKGNAECHSYSSPDRSQVASANSASEGENCSKPLATMRDVPGRSSAISQQSAQLVSFSKKTKRWSDFGTRLVSFVDKMLTNTEGSQNSSCEFDANMSRCKSYAELGSVNQRRPLSAADKLLPLSDTEDKNRPEGHNGKQINANIVDRSLLELNSTTDASKSAGRSKINGIDMHVIRRVQTVHRGVSSDN